MSNKPNLRKAGPKHDPRGERRPWWMSPIAWVAAVIAVALVVTIAVSVGGSDSDDSTDVGEETAFAEILGPPLAPLESIDSAIGTEAPRLSAQTSQGQRVEVGGDGVARLYGFFAHWCPHCQAEVPRLTAWLAENELPDGVEIVAISTAVDPSRGNYPPSAWFAAEAWPTPVLLDDTDSPLAQGFGLTGFPFWVAVDADGIVVARVSGELDIEQFEALVELVTPASAAAG